MHSSPSELWRFAEKVTLARDADRAERPRRGTSGLELEWDLLDSAFRPLQTVGAGPEETPFIDAFRRRHLAPWLAERSQLEVFQWMIEFATQPYYTPWGAVYESRVIEAALLNALARAGRAYGQRLFASTGNLLHAVEVGADSIPHGWNLAKRRYLEHCVELFGPTLATTGIHANLSLPEALLMWDFVHLPADERAHGHLDTFKNRVYVEGTRRMRAFASLFVATSASTPMRPELLQGESRVRLTDFDSVRNLTFPCPEAIDPPDLYRSHEDYLRISYDLVRRGVRFGNNNWNPVRARSFAEPVERLIEVSSEQLHDLYRQGIYAAGQARSVEEMARQVVVQNLLARIDLPMARVEVRTDEAGHPMDLEIANLAFKELLLLRIYVDPAYGAAFRYAAEDVARARRNERRAAEGGLRAEVEDPFSGKPIPMRGFLRRTLGEVAPLTEALGWKDRLVPLEEMAAGGPNTAERLRSRLRTKLGGSDLVPPELLMELAQEREQEVARDVERVRASLSSLGDDAAKLQTLLSAARDEARRDPGVPIRFRSRPSETAIAATGDKTAEILELARSLIRIGSVSGASPERRRIEEIRRAHTLVYDYLTESGLAVRTFEEGDYPALFATFAAGARPPVLLSAHLDVVDPDPDDGQFEPRLEGDYLHGRGAADMKTVLATYLVWLKDLKSRLADPPGIGLLVVSNEEIGEGEPMGTPHVLKVLHSETEYRPELLIAGERTGERGDELWGEICVENRGLVRLEVSLQGTRGHTGTRLAGEDLSARLLRARDDLRALFEDALHLTGDGEWRTQMRFPFILVGEEGIYNVAAGRGVLGIEIRPIPGEDLVGLLDRANAYGEKTGLQLRVVAAEPGISCPMHNAHLMRLIESVREVSGAEPALAKKLPATSARFAPGGAGIVWGQSGVGPHGPDERHFVPSILPYYRALERYAQKCIPEAQGA
jgi:acetylornithine deacetylase/succinyl-diaminopimelate desuccinylase-like protein/gamma-glutamyl:cysteine ligase YbdK (ATP-grasp superfamily)